MGVHLVTFSRSRREIPATGGKHAEPLRLFLWESLRATNPCFARCQRPRSEPARGESVQKSPDEEWNDCKITNWGTADLISGSGPQSGYFVNDHPEGDRDFGTFEGRIVTSGDEVTIEGTWKFTGGTGRFKGLRGGGTYKGRMISPVVVENTWHGQYEIVAKTQAA